MDTAGKGEDGVITESSTEPCTLPYVKHTASGKVLCNTGSSTWCSVTTWGGAAGWGAGCGSEVQESRGKGYMYTCA